MTFAQRLHKLVPDLAATLLRFPVPVLAALVSAVIVNVEIVNDTLWANEITESLLFAAVTAFIGSGVAHLFAEGREWDQAQNLGLAVATGLGLGLIAWFQESLALQPLYFSAGLVLALMTSGFLRADATQGAFWLFNFRIMLGALLASVVTLVFCAGLSAILASLDFLFEITVPSELYGHVWATGSALIAPIYGLSLVPVRLDEEVALERHADPMVNRGVSLLVNYVLVPIVVIYSLILHAYAVKIAATAALPKGQIGGLVTIFAIGGTATYLIAHPWRDTGTRLLKWFMGSWFWLTLVPVGLLAIAVWRRVSDYGLTPERYGLILVGVWLAAMIVYLAFRGRNADLRAIVASLAGLLLLGSVGPWGAQGASNSNQLARLEALLTRVGYLKEGRVATPPAAGAGASQADKNSIGSIIWFLIDAKADDRMRPWFDGQADDPWANDTSDAVRTKLAQRFGVQIAPIFVPGDYVQFESDLPRGFPVPPNGVLTGTIELANVDATARKELSPDDPRAVNRGSSFDIVHGGRLWSVNAKDFVDLMKTNRTTARPFSLTVDGPGGRLTIIVLRAYAQVTEGDAKMMTGSFWLILPQ